MTFVIGPEIASRFPDNSNPLAGRPHPARTGGSRTRHCPAPYEGHPMTIQRSARRSAIIMLAIAGGLALAACKPAASVPPAGAEAGASRDLLGAAPASTASPEPPAPQTGPETEPESEPGSGG